MKLFYEKKQSQTNVAVGMASEEGKVATYNEFADNIIPKIAVGIVFPQIEISSFGDV